MMPDAVDRIVSDGARWWASVHIESLLPDGSSVAHPVAYHERPFFWGSFPGRMSLSAFHGCLTCGGWWLPPR